MSGEKSVDVEKINNNEKGFEPAHIRSVISLALFSFVFLGMEFFFDSGAAEFVDARSVLLYQSVILLASAVGLFIYALIERYVGSKIKQIIIITLNIVEVAALAAIILCSGKLILLYGIIFFIVCGVMGGRVYHDVSRDYTDRKHLTVIVGISYALGLLLQYINYNLIDSVILRMVMFSLAIVALAVILFLARDEYAEAEVDTYMVDERNKTDCKEKCDKTTPDSGSVAVALVMVVLLMTFIFSALDNVVTVVHAEGGADVGQWPRLFLALSGVAAGFLFDIKDQRFMILRSVFHDRIHKCILWNALVSALVWCRKGSQQHWCGYCGNNIIYADRFPRNHGYECSGHIVARTYKHCGICA